ncbi:MAG TPA: hypothetical protein VNI56_02695 [Xanthomonadaceae bacterium]|nr:hypothetical protein [Xanthomonadaceae bacterium]
MTDPLQDPPVCLWSAEEIDDAIAELEAKMESLQARHKDVFALASSWAAHHDAIMAATPEQLRGQVEQRLHRIGIRWGVAKGARITGQFPAFKG